MTNREMVSGAAKVSPEAAPKPNTRALPPMPADEGSATPTTQVEPIDSPQPNASAGREPPSAEKSGLATKR
ncbi:hypothetical protein ACFZ8E_16490 [Methylobacterium sp. HMF5984]|uniref:hypothetical protein n=1 Tax=unclassified Methylobacterium TaxID=2615210 RepID=UPI001FB9398E|nr:MULTISPECIES: hypothetical protein [unclassified Methylobacterium]MCJ2007326.1 hypothetical protein [Methylobacterium sp. J-092]MCJ2037964.1 hypothetical protein [Methylobacterium sp. J-059]MCJ2077124.1 hypothetical protein [Methylobacterium sp. E-016]MCJ2110061.1 hypothetical protein [Methylobacterium sp. E-025]